MLFSCLLFAGLASTSAITAALKPRATTTTCAADNCYRALSNRYIPTASAFCSTYTTQATATVPAFATSGCANNPSRVSSACTCLATEYGQPKPFHRVYGGATGIDGTAYDIYNEALNIRSDDLPSGSYDEYLGRCQDMCDYYGNSCQTYSFVTAKYGASQFYLCYVYAAQYLFDPSKVTPADGYTKNVVGQRYQN